MTTPASDPTGSAETLADRLAHRRLTPAETRVLAGSLAHALQTVHRARLVHGAVAPTSILVVDGRWHLGEGRHANAPAFCAPEAFAEGRLGRPADLYSLGCVLFAALTGNPPYLSGDRLALGSMHRSRPVPALPKSVRVADPLLTALVHDLLAKDPPARPTAADVVRLVGHHAGAPAPSGPPSAPARRRSPAPPPPAPPPAPAPDARVRRPRRRRVLVGTAVGVAVLAGLTALGPVAGDGQGETRTATVAAAPAPAASLPLAREVAGDPGASRSFAVPRLVGLTQAAARGAVAEAAGAAGAAPAQVVVLPVTSGSASPAGTSSRRPSPGAGASAPQRSTVVVTVAGAPAPPPAPVIPPEPDEPTAGCHPGYEPCLPVVDDLDCPDVGGPVGVVGWDGYRLDADDDGVGCERN